MNSMDKGEPTTSSARSIPDWLAPLVQEFELTGQTILTINDIRRARPDLHRAVIRQGITDLVRRGWLRPVGVRGIYEFIPGAAAGPYPSGDPWLVLRAELLRWPGKFHIGATSAAWLRGYAQRSPRPHIVVTTPDAAIPRPLRTTYRVLTTRPAPAHDTIDGLPVPTPAELLAEVAQLAPRLALDGAQGWLRRLLADTSPEEIVVVLRDRNAATRARAGYIAAVCGGDAHAAAIAAIALPSGGPYYTGPRTTDAPFSARWRVYDTGRLADA
jgi:hypothetical protein